MKKVASVDEFILRHDSYREELIVLRKLCLKARMEETIKWGSPVYTSGGKNIVGLGAFKSYVGLWFYQGVFLKDNAKKLISAQDGVTKALRQWRFASAKDMDAALISKYLQEAIQNQMAGKEVKPDQKKPLLIPIELKGEFAKNEELHLHFNKLGLTKQREFVGYIDSAKREETRRERLKKSIALILAGVGLYDKYKGG